MKGTKKRGLLCGVLLAGALVLTGCGEELYELEDNEREIIVNYAAHIIAKYNVRQSEGYRFVYVSEEDEDEEDEPAAEETEAEETAAEEETAQTDASGQAASAEAPETAAVTLSEALGLSGINAVYTGAELTDHYNSVIPDAGNQLMILHVTLQNPGTEDAECDIMSLLPTFRATVNGTVETTAELTILTENLSTWEDPIPAGGSVDTIILFQLGDTQITAVEQLEMKVFVGGRVSTVVFL